MAAPAVPSTPSVSTVRALRPRGRPEGGRSSCYVALVVLLPVLSEGKNSGAAFAAAQPAEAQFFVAAAARGAAALLELLRWRVALKLWPHSCVQVVLWLRVLEHLWRDAKAAFWLRVADASRLASELRCSKSSAAFVSRSRPLARIPALRACLPRGCAQFSPFSARVLTPQSCLHTLGLVWALAG